MNAREIQKLKKKFILIAMSSMFLAMSFIGVALNLVNYVVTQGQIQETLEYLVENRGVVSEKDMGGKDGKRSSSLPQLFIQLFSKSYQRSRYYVFIYDSEGKEISSERKTNYSDEYWEAEAEYYAQDGLQDSRTYGQQYATDIFFMKNVEENGWTVLALLDAQIILRTQWRLIFASLAVGGCGLLIAWILIVSFSDRMIRPEIENSRRQDQFITNASHELKTPLAVIRSNTEMVELLSGESEWTQSTIRQVDRMSGLIQNLVMITRSREQENKVRRTMTDVSAAILDSVKAFESILLQEEKRLEEDVDPELVMEADESLIRQLCTLLMDNAIKYCDEKGLVRVSLKKEKKKGVRLTVSNSYKDGKNVDCSRFFDRFYRQDQSHNIDRGGYGIGLSIAESICSSHNGSIKAEWKDGMISFICCLF